MSRNYTFIAFLGHRKLNGLGTVFVLYRGRRRPRIFSSTVLKTLESDISNAFLLIIFDALIYAKWNLNIDGIFRTSSRSKWIDETFLHIFSKCVIVWTAFVDSHTSVGVKKSTQVIWLGPLESHDDDLLHILFWTFQELSRLMNFRIFPLFPVFEKRNDTFALTQL